MAHALIYFVPRMMRVAFTFFDSIHTQARLHSSLPHFFSHKAFLTFSIMANLSGPFCTQCGRLHLRFHGLPDYPPLPPSLPFPLGIAPSFCSGCGQIHSYINAETLLTHGHEPDEIGSTAFECHQPQIVSIPTLNISSLSSTTTPITSAAHRKATGIALVQPSLTPSLPFDSFRALESAVNTARTGRNLVIPVGRGRPQPRTLASTSTRPSRGGSTSANLALTARQLVTAGGETPLAGSLSKIIPTITSLEVQVSLLYRKLHWDDIDTPNETRERIQRLEGSEQWDPTEEALDFQLTPPFESCWRGLLFHKVIRKTGLWKRFESTIFLPSQDDIQPVIYRATLFRDWNARRHAGGIRLPASELEKRNNTLRSIITSFFPPPKRGLATMFILLEYTYPSPSPENSISHSASLPAHDTPSPPLSSNLGENTTSSPHAPCLQNNLHPQPPSVIPHSLTIRTDQSPPPNAEQLESSLSSFSLQEDLPIYPTGDRLQEAQVLPAAPKQLLVTDNRQTVIAGGSGLPECIGGVPGTPAEGIVVANDLLEDVSGAASGKVFNHLKVSY